MYYFVAEQLLKSLCVPLHSSCAARLECTVEIGNTVFGAREICVGAMGIILLITVAVVSMKNAISGGELGTEPLGEINDGGAPVPAPYSPSDAYNGGAVVYHSD